MDTTTHPGGAIITTLKEGAHSSPEDGACLLEAASYLAGEPFSDHPECVSPILSSFGRRLNDAMPDDATRDLFLLPLIPRLLNTAYDGKDLSRIYLCANWAVRSIAPLVLDFAGLTEQAEALRELPEVVDNQTARTAKKAVEAAYDAAIAVEEVTGSVYSCASDSVYSYTSDYAYTNHVAHPSFSGYAAFATFSTFVTFDGRANRSAGFDWSAVTEFFSRLIDGDLESCSVPTDLEAYEIQIGRALQCLRSADDGVIAHTIEILEGRR